MKNVRTHPLYMRICNKRFSIQYRAPPPTEALALIGRPVYVNLGTYNCSERHEHLCQFGVPELLG